MAGVEKFKIAGAECRSVGHCSSSSDLVRDKPYTSVTQGTDGVDGPLIKGRDEPSGNIVTHPPPLSLEYLWMNCLIELWQRSSVDDKSRYSLQPSSISELPPGDSKSLKPITRISAGLLIELLEGGSEDDEPRHGL